MRIHFTVLAAIALLLAVCAFLSSDVARAGDPAEDAARQAARLLVYDVRIVRVVTPTPEGVEQPCPFLRGDATTITASWGDVLDALKKRGTTTLLMDQRVTGCAGDRIKMSDERQVPVLQFTTKTLTSETHQAARIRSGCKIELIGGPDGLMNYRAEIRGATDPTSSLATAAMETLTSWEGCHAALDGRTLVLSHRVQVLDPGDKNARGVELYCFILGRRAAVR